MTQRIMLRDRKYLHAELIGRARPLSPAVSAARIIVRLPEIAKLQPRSAGALARAALRLQKYERDYTERYFGSVSSANETREKARAERPGRRRAPRGALVSRPTCEEHAVCGMDYASAQSQISLYRAEWVQLQRPRSFIPRVGFPPPPASCARIFAGCTPRAPPSVSHPHARARARTGDPSHGRID